MSRFTHVNMQDLLNTIAGHVDQMVNNKGGEEMKTERKLHTMMDGIPELRFNWNLRHQVDEVHEEASGYRRYTRWIDHQVGFFDAAVLMVEARKGILKLGAVEWHPNDEFKQVEQVLEDKLQWFARHMLASQELSKLSNVYSPGKDLHQAWVDMSQMTSGKLARTELEPDYYLYLKDLFDRTFKECVVRTPKGTTLDITRWRDYERLIPGAQKRLEGYMRMAERYVEDNRFGLEEFICSPWRFDKEGLTTEVDIMGSRMAEVGKTLDSEFYSYLAGEKRFLEEGEQKLSYRRGDASFKHDENYTHDRDELVQELLSETIALYRFWDDRWYRGDTLPGWFKDNLKAFMAKVRMYRFAEQQDIHTAYGKDGHLKWHACPTIRINKKQYMMLVNPIRHILGRTKVKLTREAQTNAQALAVLKQAKGQWENLQHQIDEELATSPEDAMNQDVTFFTDQDVVTERQQHLFVL